MSNAQKDEAQKQETLSKMFDARGGKKVKENTMQLNKVFENITLVCIVLSSILLVVDNPLYDPDSFIMKIVKYMDLVFTVLFFFEAMIKLIAKGLLFNNLGPI